MDKATEEQANRLLELGFNQPARPRPSEGYKSLEGRMDNADFIKSWVIRMRKGRNRKAASVGFIMSHISKVQAGALIREFKKQLGIGRKPNITPQRQFLNEDETHNSQILTEEAVKQIAIGAKK